MNKKLIISKTILFVSIILFILLFQQVFGVNNTLIGVTVITAALMLLERDFTVSPFKYSLYLIGLNLFLGISSFIASKYLWIGIPINFITVFIIGFLLCYDLKSNMYIPFGLQYIFMLSVPVDTEELGIRLLSLVAGAIFIMAMQMICNKNKLMNSGNKIIEYLLNDLMEKTQLAMKEEETEDIDNMIKGNMIKLKKIIYHKRKDFFYLTDRGRIKLNIVATVGSINNKIEELKRGYSQNNETEILNNIHIKLKNILDNKSNIKALKELKKEKNKVGKNNIDNILNILCSYFIQLNSIKEKDYINQKSSVPEEFEIINILKRNFQANTLRFSYGFRLAFCVTLSNFIMDYFNIYEGRWMVYTVFSLIQPYSEHARARFKQRMEGTLLGGMIFIVLFTIFNNQTIRSIIVVLAGYIDGYNTRYNRKILCVTISALGVASITSTIGLQLFYRILFVGLGVILSWLANKLIFPYSLKDANKDLINMINSTVVQLTKEIKLYTKERKNNNSIENLFIISTLIENKLILNDSEQYNEVFKNKKKIINNLYEKYILMENDVIKV